MCQLFSFSKAFDIFSHLLARVPFDVFGEVEKHTTIKLPCALEGEHAYLLTVCTSVPTFLPNTIKRIKKKLHRGRPKMPKNLTFGVKIQRDFIALILV